MCCRPALRVQPPSVLQSQSVSRCIDPCPVHVLNTVGQVLRWHGLLFDSLRGPHPLLPLSRQFPQYSSRPWAIRQLMVQDAIRRRDTPTILSLEKMRMVTKRSRESLRALEKSGHQNVPERNQEVSEVVHNAHLCVRCQHFPSGTCRIQILTTVPATNPTPSRSPCLSLAAATNSKVATIKLHSARCCESILTM